MTNSKDLKQPKSKPAPSRKDRGKTAEIENNLLQEIFACRSTEAVEASISFASFLTTVGVTPENCPLFLKMLEIENHWVIDALIAGHDPFLLLSPVQPNNYIVESIFAMVTKWHKGSIYPKNLSVIIGVLQSVYGSPEEGYRIYPITISNLNAIGKHLEKEKGQNNPLNRAILEILDKISDLERSADPEIKRISKHAAEIRNTFFDNKKKMEDIIPPALLATPKNRVEIRPKKK